MSEPTPLYAEAARAGAAFTDDGRWQVPAHFGDAAAEYRAAHAGAAAFDQSPRGKVEVSGPDAPRFLHNLSSNDVLNLAPGAGCEAFLMTAKARVVAYLLLYHLPAPGGGPAFWLDLAPEMAPKVIRHLDYYLISERVEFTDHTTALAQVHVAGPRAGDVLGRVAAGLPPLEDLHAAHAGGPGGTLQVRRHDGLGVPGYDILCQAFAAAPLWEALLAAGARPAGREAYEALRVEAGTPAYGVDIDENTFAPEAGRTARAISYTKGCYLGQEPIVMARDRGQVNRTLLHVTLPAGPVPPGSPLFRDGKEVGRVTSSVRPPGKDAAVGLAYVRRGSQDPGTALEVEVAGRRHPCTVGR
jgi:folate-binding protein YgfZ